MTNIISGSTRTSTTKTTPAPPTPAPFAPDVQRRRTTLIRSPATRAALVPCSAARRATRHLHTELCSPLYMRPTTWLLHIWRRRHRNIGCLFVLHIPSGKPTGWQIRSAPVPFPSLACLFVTLALLSFVFVRFDTCPVHGTASLLGPKICFHLWTHQHHLPFAFGYILTTFPLFISICT